MTTWKVTNRLTGEVIHAYEADAPTAWEGMGFDVCNHTAIVPEDPAPVRFKITKFAYRKRFTTAEKAALEMACLDDPTKPMAQRAMAATLRASQLDAMSATYVDLTPGPLLEETRAAMMPLESLDILAAGRVSEILDTAPVDSELYR